MISISHVSFGYRGSGRELFRELSLEMPSGRIYGLLGRNGAGKTSLLKLLDGLQRGSGEIRVFGNLSAGRLPQMLADLYVVPEELHTPALAISEHVNLYSPFYPRFDRSRMNGLLAEFGLPSNGMIGSLSYGQKKKYFLAFGLASGTRVLILDEPTNGLDIPSKTQFRNLLAQYRHPDRIIIISTHQVRDVDNLIDAVIVLENGTILFNEGIDRVADRLSFGVAPEAPPSVIYSESVPGGVGYVSARNGNAASRVDLELLFNAVITRPDAVNMMCKEVA